MANGSLQVNSRNCTMFIIDPNGNRIPCVCRRPVNFTSIRDDYLNDYCYESLDVAAMAAANDISCVARRDDTIEYGVSIFKKRLPRAKFDTYFLTDVKKGDDDSVKRNRHSEIFSLGQYQFKGFIHSHPHPQKILDPTVRAEGSQVFSASDYCVSYSNQFSLYIVAIHLKDISCRRATSEYVNCINRNTQGNCNNCAAWMAMSNVRNAAENAWLAADKKPSWPTWWPPDAWNAAWRAAATTVASGGTAVTAWTQAERMWSATAVNAPTAAKVAWSTVVNNGLFPPQWEPPTPNMTIACTRNSVAATLNIENGLLMKFTPPPKTPNNDSLYGTVSKIKGKERHLFSSYVEVASIIPISGLKQIVVPTMGTITRSIDWVKIDYPYKV